ncbi:MAG: DNA-3-methyladenine glycosylase [Bacteroidota bacterium]
MNFEINTRLYEKLDRSFYLNEDVVQVAKNLLGSVLVSQVDGVLAAGKIVETEAYCGRGDKACHANGKKTPRTEVMYQSGGVAYIYLCYGIHHLINVVTNKEGQADAVLIRALEPLVGLDEMNVRRNIRNAKSSPRLTSGPGTLTQAMGINVKMTGTDLQGDTVWVAPPLTTESFDILSDTRIGVDYAEEDALRPWRFVIAGNKFVSKPAKVG